MQVDPITPKLKPPGAKLLKLKYDNLLSNFAFEFKLRRYATGACDLVDAPCAYFTVLRDPVAGPCRLTLSNPR